MTTTLITGGGIVAAIIITGAWLRWAVRPALVGYRAGAAVGRQTIGALERQQTLLIRTLGYAVADATEPSVRERPSRSEWYDRPLPIAVLTAVLRPRRAVRRLRSADDATAWMLDAMLARERKRHSDTGPQFAATGA